MKVLIFGMVLACYSIAHYAPVISKQFDDYKASSACIGEKVKLGIKRSDIIVVDGSCKVRVK